MRENTINNFEEALIVLNQAKEVNQQFEETGAYKADDEKYSSYIQEMYIFSLSDFFLGKMKINNKNMVKAMIFEDTIWDYITSRIDIEELMDYFKDENLI